MELPGLLLQPNLHKRKMPQQREEKEPQAQSSENTKRKKSSCADSFRWHGNDRQVEELLVTLFASPSRWRLMHPGMGKELTTASCTLFSQRLFFSWFFWTHCGSSDNIEDVLWCTNSVAGTIFLAYNSYRQTSESHFTGLTLEECSVWRIKCIFKGTHIIVLLRTWW